MPPQNVYNLHNRVTAVVKSDDVGIGLQLTSRFLLQEALDEHLLLLSTEGAWKGVG